MDRPGDRSEIQLRNKRLQVNRAATAAAATVTCRNFSRVITKTMIDVQEAVRIAVQYFGQLFGFAGRLRLEEVELSADEKHWFITVGFQEARPPGVAITEAIQGYAPITDERQYRVVDLDTETGKVRAVKIRQPLERVS